MLKIRLSRHGRKKRPFYRIVLTEHTKSIKSGYQEVLGWFDPMAHKYEADLDLIKSWIEKGAQPSERVAKILYNGTKDEFFKKFIVIRERVRTVRNPSEEELAAMEAKKEETKEKVKPEVKEEVKKEEKKEETKVEVKEEVKEEIKELEKKEEKSE